MKYYILKMKNKSSHKNQKRLKGYNKYSNI
jgi:hypothetical protein